MTPQTGQFLVAAVIAIVALVAGAIFLFGPRNWDSRNQMDFEKWGPLPTGDADNDTVQDGDETDEPEGL